ncbi:MAG: M13 family metallopeptidase, partial [Bacteroidia bacterium]
MKKIILLSALATIGFYACNNSEKKAEEKTSFSDPIAEHIDSTISPGKNFFLFANNNWFKQHPIPSSEKSNGIWRTIQDTINESIKKICEKSAADTKAEKGSNKQKIGDFYFSGMDTASIEKAGISMLADEFKKIDAVKSIPELISSVTHLYSISVSSMFGFSVTRDDKNSEKYVVYLGQTHLGLPDRDYYFNTDSRTNNIRTEYVKHLKNIFHLIGDDDKAAEKNSNTIMKLETTIAKSNRKMEDLRDPYKNYNKMSLSQVGKLTPSINWTQTLLELGLKNIDSVVVGQPEVLAALEVNLKKTDIADWKTYLKWTLINRYANYVNKSIVDEHFNFYATILDGVKMQKPRWKKMVENTDNMLGELIGQVYVDEYTPKGTKEKLLEIGNNIRDVYAEHIKALDWMSDVTKQKALSKLNKIVMKVG